MLDRLKKKQPEDELKVLREDEQKRTLVVTREIPMQARAAQNVPPELVAEFLELCRRNSVIQSCLLLDTRERDAGNDNTKLFVRLILSDQAQSESVTDQFLLVLKAFPSQADNTYLSCTVDEFDGFLPFAIYDRAKAEHGAV